MEFEKCKQCKYLSESIFAGSVENFCMVKGWPTPIELVVGCETFEKRKFPIWEVFQVGKLYGVAKVRGIENVERITIVPSNGDRARNLWFYTKEEAEMVAAALNQSDFKDELNKK